MNKLKRFVMEFALGNEPCTIFAIIFTKKPNRIEVEKRSEKGRRIWKQSKKKRKRRSGNAK